MFHTLGIMPRLALLLAVFLASKAWAIDVGQTWPEVSLKALDGAQVLKSADLKGKVSVINFWATWCEACKVELVEMDRQLGPLLQNPGFRLVLVALDKEPAKALSWLQGHLAGAKTLARLAFDDSNFALAERLEVDSFPMTLIVDSQLKVVYVQRGFTAGQGMTENLVKKVRALLLGNKQEA